MLKFPRFALSRKQTSAGAWLQGQVAELHAYEKQVNLVIHLLYQRLDLKMVRKFGLGGKLAKASLPGEGQGEGVFMKRSIGLGMNGR